MKIYLRNQESFNPETIKFYQEHFEFENEQYADIIVINDFKDAIYPDKIVACNSTGLDHIQAREIISLRGEDLSDITAVAELCLGMAIYCTRIFKGEEVKGKTLGLIGGYGRIAKKFGEYAEGVGMKITIYDYFTSSNLFQKEALEDLLSKSDIVSLHITADEKNRNFIKKEHFEQMKDGAIFLNSARPWLVNEKDFYWALQSKLAGAWFDFEMLLPNPKSLVTTPHLGGATKESRAKTEMKIAKKLLN